MNASDKRVDEGTRITPVGRYLWVLAALMVLLAISAGSALIKLGPFNTIINMAVAAAKTSLVMLIFMHETEARNLTRMTSALGFVWLAMLIGLALIDFLSRAHVPPPW
ncbi:MAG: cytochrome C oxidase subunit IV family protein [Rhodanobacteraceae bacterium]